MYLDDEGCSIHVMFMYLDDDKSTVMFMYLDDDGCTVLYCTEMEKGSTDLAGY